MSILLILTIWVRSTSERSIFEPLLDSHTVRVFDAVFCDRTGVLDMYYLVGIDGSAESDEAVRWAAKHASKFGAALDIVHVLTPETQLIDEEVVISGDDAAVTKGQRILQRARDLALEIAEDNRWERDIDTELLTGRPAKAIVEHAAEMDVDVIYVGHRGVSSERKRIVGSVAKSVVDRATVPVMVIR